MRSRKVLYVILSVEKINEAKLDQMKRDKVIAHDLRTPLAYLAEDLNSFITPIQRSIMKELLSHIDELNIHIQNLNDEIDNRIKPDERLAVEAIKPVTRLEDDSALQLYLLLEQI